MPSSLIVVALAAAWLVVLVPMIARKRQEVAKTTDSALSARVIRSGGALDSGRRGTLMSENPGLSTEDEDQSELPDAPEEPSYSFDSSAASSSRADSDRRYRPGRGGFDPEAAEAAARAKYVYRQRVVAILIVVAVLSAVAAVIAFPLLWIAHALADIGLVGYLVYLRRQVRIENEIRQRRLARYHHARALETANFRQEIATPRVSEEMEASESRRFSVGVERKSSSTPRTRRQAVAVALDDEDPAFYELAGQVPQTFRRASGE